MSDEFRLGEKSIVSRHRTRTKKFKFFNKIMNGVSIFLYRVYLLPLFGIGRRIILLDTIGWKTGKRRTTPVLALHFYTEYLTLYIARGMKAHWLKNILASENQEFRIQKGFKKMHVQGVLIEDQEEKFKHLKYYFEELPEARYIFGYNREKNGDVFQTEGFKEILDIIEFLQIIPIKK